MEFHLGVVVLHDIVSGCLRSFLDRLGAIPV